MSRRRTRSYLLSDTTHFTAAGVEFFFFNDTATTEIYTLSLHDALPIWPLRRVGGAASLLGRGSRGVPLAALDDRKEVGRRRRSEEHTSELQSRQYLVCRLLLEKKNIPVIGRLPVFTPIPPIYRMPSF